MAIPRVSVVLLSYARPTMLAASLRAACSQTWTSTEILVVDNESPHSPEIAETVASFPGVRLVRSGRNLGFASGMNRGIREASGDFVLLTEDDILLSPGAVRSFVEAATSSPGPTLFSGVMRDQTTDEVWYAGGEVELASVYRLRLPHRGQSAVDEAAVYPTGYLSGALVFGAAPLLRHLGGYRDDFFMYSEDVEFSLRAMRHGVALRIVRDAEVRHFTPSAGRAADYVEFHKLKNRLALYLLHAEAGSLPGGFFRYGALEPLRALIRRDLATVHARALGWVLLNASRLLRDRRRLRSATKLGGGSVPSPASHWSAAGLSV